MANILITRPEDDRSTKYISTWANEFINLATSKGHKVLDLHKERATRSQVESMVKKQRPAFIFFNGHGNADLVTGYMQEPLVIVNDNENILENSVTYALACDCASNLGIQAVEKGAIAFIGYSKPYALFWDENVRTLPLQDSLAKYFLEPSNLFVKSLLKGNTTGEAMENAKTAYLKNIVKLSSSDATDKELASVPFLFRNYRSFIMHGNTEARIV